MRWIHVEFELCVKTDENCFIDQLLVTTGMGLEKCTVILTEEELNTLKRLGLTP